MDNPNEIERQVLRYLLARVRLTTTPGVDYAYMQREWSTGRLRVLLAEVRDEAVAEGWFPTGGTVRDVARVNLSDAVIEAALSVAVAEERERRVRRRDRTALAGITPEAREELIRLVALRTRVPVEEVRCWPPEELRTYLAELTAIRDRHASETA